MDSANGDPEPALWSDLMGAAIVAGFALPARTNITWLLVVAATIVVRFLVSRRWAHLMAWDAVGFALFGAAMGIAHGLAFGRDFATALAFLVPGVVLIGLGRDFAYGTIGRSIYAEQTIRTAVGIGYAAVSVAAVLDGPAPVSQWIEFSSIMLHGLAALNIVYALMAWIDERETSHSP